MTDKQNFEKDINVPHKEQIIIDGINVVDCNYIIDHDPQKKQGTWGGAIHKGACKIYSKDCKHNPDCYFKQLAHKTQECEELKERVTIAEDNFACEIQARLYHQNEWLKFSKEADRYRKALEEIEKEVHDEMCDTLGHLCAYCDGKHSCITLKILDIINQAKGKNNG